MFMSSTVEASVCMGKNYSDILHSIKNTWENVTLKQMFDMSEKLIVGQSDEILISDPPLCYEVRWGEIIVSDQETQAVPSYVIARV